LKPEVTGRSLDVDLRAEALEVNALCIFKRLQYMTLKLEYNYKSRRKILRRSDRGFAEFAWRRRCEEEYFTKSSRSQKIFPGSDRSCEKDTRMK
jgi:hypothetical protein